VPVDVVLTTRNLPEGGEGPQGWSLSIANNSCMTVEKVTLKGVTVSTIYCQDTDEDPDTPCDLHDPFTFDLGGAFTNVANRATGTPPSPINDPTVAGVISAVVMKSRRRWSSTPMPATPSFGSSIACRWSTARPPIAGSTSSMD